MTSRRLGMKLKAIRKARGMSQLGLAKKAQVAQSYIWSLERGEKRNPGIDVLQKLAQALGVPVVELLK